MRRFGLRDDQWERIKNLLLGREGSVGVTAADNRLFVEAVLYRYRTGMPWRDLPERFGEGTKIYTRFSRWAKSGVWKRMFRESVHRRRCGACWWCCRPSAARVPSCSRPSMTLRAASRWPSAIIDRRCARRHVMRRSGRRDGRLDRTTG